VYELPPIAAYSQHVDGNDHGLTYAFNSDRTVVGHIDAGLLGAIQASEDGNVVNHMLYSP